MPSHNHHSSSSCHSIAITQFIISSFIFFFIFIWSGHIALLRWWWVNAATAAASRPNLESTNEQMLAATGRKYKIIRVEFCMYVVVVVVYAWQKLPTIAHIIPFYINACFSRHTHTHTHILQIKKIYYE